MLRSLLIANRGEIACRIIRTARRLGVRTIAVYSEADAGARHVALADEAVAIGPAPARDSYLDIARIIDAARRTKAEAIHPGYGFLSENPAFAEACDAARIVFVGPPAAAMRALGDKARAKALMAAAGVPVVPGYHGEDQAEARFAAEAQRILYPVLVKAAAGGGGRGMRVVERAGELAAALASARREAEAAFGDGRLLLESYLARPRHIEVQIFADRAGHAIHLFERDCSVQRRHQKIIEEAPAPGLSAERRAALGAYAVTAARTASYVGAGTVEFVAAGDQVYFIEMNTRLQVEHPVTEMITGLDLVEWQLRVAAGEDLPLPQDRVERRGHAIEVRLYAEDPARDFLPQTGRLLRLSFPAEDAALRVESGVVEGDAVGVHYDAMLAKLIAWDAERGAALARLRRALEATRVAGVVTNRDFLLRVLAQDEFAAGPVDTGFLARHRDALLPAPRASFAALACAALALSGELPAPAPADPHSPWARRDGWRIAGREPMALHLVEDGAERIVRVLRLPDGVRVEAEGETALVQPRRTECGDLAFELGGHAVAATVLARPGSVTIILAEETRRFAVRDPLAPAADATAGGALLVAPMPGKILAVHVAPGETVARGQLLVVLEAMKMEHAVTAPGDGVVDAVHFRAGDPVEEGALLISFTAA